MMTASETSSLLGPQHNKSETYTTAEATAFPILVELIGARNLPIAEDMETYCVISYGHSIIHRTKPFSPKLSKTDIAFNSTKLLLGGESAFQSLQQTLKHPIWTVHHNCLFTLSVTKKDLDNSKVLTITLWARPRQKRLRERAVLNGMVKNNKRYAERIKFVGKVRIKAPKLLQMCTEKRIKFDLVDELDRPLADNRHSPSLLAARFRPAHEADQTFVNNWLVANKNDSQVPITAPAMTEIWKDTGIAPYMDRPRAPIVTEMAEAEVRGASLRSAVAGSIAFSPRVTGRVIVKPYPNPRAPKTSQSMTPNMIKTQTKLPSSKWIHAGTPQGSVGRLYVEVLSAHNLPNVDYGSTVGNETDSFCSIIYGDTLVETDIIDDELSPHWLPWTQRAFVFHIQQPAHVLYLSVFGFKRKMLAHQPIGRVEINTINLQRDTVYELEYALNRLSHGGTTGMMRTDAAHGTIRLRIRVEIDDERKALLAVLRPPQAVYVNVKQRKSLVVAKYTSCGEYDDEEKFSLRVFHGYIDEILQNYLRRILYSFGDGIRSLIFWRDQVYFGDMGFPLYSLMIFVVGGLLIENPALLPCFCCWGIAWLFLVQLQIRRSSPSPWRRCPSFLNFMRILLIGSSKIEFESVVPNEGWTETVAAEEALKKRLEEDKVFHQKKEAAEKEIEVIESEAVETKVKMAVPLELLSILGKVQGIVGNFCRLCRSIDVIITWEESAIAFFITLVCLLAGIICLIIPWNFLLTWLGRIIVVLLFGPQNKLVDIFWYQKRPKDERRLRKLLAERLNIARYFQEEATKLKAFRNALFGKYSTQVPSIMWTPHKDYPMPTSTARRSGVQKHSSRTLSKNSLFVPGQGLHGFMIPRPAEESSKCRASKSALKKFLKENSDRKKSNVDDDVSMDVSTTYHEEGQTSIGVDEGFEVTSLYDEEAGFVKRVCEPSKNQFEESIYELGVEVLKGGGSNEELEEKERYKTVWRSGAINTAGIAEHQTTIPPKSPAVPGRANVALVTGPGQSKRSSSLGDEFGFEITEYFAEEELFVEGFQSTDEN